MLLGLHRFDVLMTPGMQFKGKKASRIGQTVTLMSLAGAAMSPSSKDDKGALIIPSANIQAGSGRSLPEI